MKVKKKKEDKVKVKEIGSDSETEVKPKKSGMGFEHSYVLEESSEEEKLEITEDENERVSYIN